MVYRELKAEYFMQDAHLTRKDIPKLLIVDGHWAIKQQMRKFRPNLTRIRKLHGF